jgi:NAD(P) transhydrogenase
MSQLNEWDGAAFDLVVVGLGPAGEKAAAQAAYFGKRVAGIEAGAIGGAVVNTGTLPSKTLRETALYLSGLRSRNLYGIDYSFSREISAADLFHRQKIIEASHLDLVRANLERHHVQVLEGAAQLEDPHTALIRGAAGESARVRGDFVLVATGSRPARPASIPFDGEFVFDSDSILGMQRIPASLIVIGAGVIGSEYATLFAALGTRVTLVSEQDDLLPFLDREVSAILRQQMEFEGAGVLLGKTIETVTVLRDDRAVAVTTLDGETLTADAVLYCGGRQANTDSLGLERLGIAVDRRGRVEVDAGYRTCVPSVLAAGDVIGFPALASTAMEQGRVAVCRAFGFDYKQQVSGLVPYALYTIPEVSMVGASEDALRAEGQPYLVGRARYGANARAQILGDTMGLVKLLFEPESLRLLGAHIIGERAAELIHVAQMCMQFGGTINVFIENVFNFPTLGDAYKYAAYDGLQARDRWRTGAAKR